MNFRAFRWLVLIGLSLAIKLFSLFPQAVEKYYSQGIYPAISITQRFLLGWLPFSMGDLLYAVAGLFLIIAMIRVLKKVFSKSFQRQDFFSMMRKLFAWSMIIYCWFNLSWGLNYNRPNVAARMDLSIVELNKDDLVELMMIFVEQLNNLYPEQRMFRAQPFKKSEMFEAAGESYNKLAQQNNRFQYRLPALKPSLYSYPGNFLGFTGYYNPFTGEAQVNTTVPRFVQPFVSCHEIGHQLGFAIESEANFAGFLAGISSDEPAFRYSAYFDMYRYARTYLFIEDSLLLKQVDTLLLPGIREDMRELRRFYQQYAGPLERVIDRAYSFFLKANEQPSGKISYNEVIFLLYAWYSKKGLLSGRLKAKIYSSTSCFPPGGLADHYI